MVVTVSHRGYIKRVPLSTYRAQHRGGKGRSGMSTRDEDFVTQLFVANTHTPVLFFSSAGMVYRMKVWRLPVGTPQARGKAMINLLPLGQNEIITTVMPMPEDEQTWADLQIMFATRSGGVRRNKLADFININRGGKIAMKLEDEDDGIVGVQICTPDDDVVLTTANGRCIRFQVDDVRVFAGRTSTGVRGIRLSTDKALGDDKIISMTILRHVETTPAEARAYLKQANAVRRAASGDRTLKRMSRSLKTIDEDDAEEEVPISPERYAQLGAAEQFVLTVSENGYGKRTSAYEYRVSGRGGKGIIAMAVNNRNGHLIASFPVEDGDGIMLVTDAGQLIRCPVSDIRVAGRSTQGVTVFKTATEEHVVSVERLSEEDHDAEPDTEPNQATHILSVSTCDALTKP